MTVRVEINQGTLKGKKCTTFSGSTYYSFEGIPYAKPPVGGLRFRDPQPPDNWAGVRDATKPGQKCAQLNPFSRTLDGSEDCLFLNVYTPTVLPEGKKLPVLFFVHGGRLLMGHGDYYRPDFLIPHDVIVVTINYRLHILGFLCLNTAEVPGNAGVKDTVMALKWVKNNISKFNGDDNNVTVIGESAGGFLASSLMATKVADDLFHKIILQSATHMTDFFMDNTDPVAKAMHAMSFLGKKFDDTECLYNYLMDLPVDKLLFGVSKAERSLPSFLLGPYFNSEIEKQFGSTEPCFTENVAVTMQENRYRKMPVLLGVQSNEGAILLLKNGVDNFRFERDLREFVPKCFLLPKESVEAENIANTLKKVYFNGKEINDDTLDEYIELLGDVNFARDVMLTANFYSKRISDVFLYDFHYRGNLNSGFMKNLNMKGASHGDVQQYLFYNEKKVKNCTSDDMKIVNFVTESWTNFAKTSNPSTRCCNWQPFTQETKLCLKIDNEIKNEQYSRWPKMEFWREIYMQHPSSVNPYSPKLLERKIAKETNTKFQILRRATSAVKRIA